jgi:hypothetical protein
MTTDQVLPTSIYCSDLTRTALISKPPTMVTNGQRQNKSRACPQLGVYPSGQEGRARRNAIYTNAASSDSSLQTEPYAGR